MDSEELMYTLEFKYKLPKPPLFRRAQKNTIFYCTLCLLGVAKIFAMLITQQTWNGGKEEQGWNPLRCAKHTLDNHNVENEEQWSDKWQNVCKGKPFGN